MTAAEYVDEAVHLAIIIMLVIIYLELRSKNQ